MGEDVALIRRLVTLRDLCIVAECHYPGLGKVRLEKIFRPEDLFGLRFLVSFFDIA